MPSSAAPKIRKYDALGAYLRQSQSEKLRLSLAEISALVGALPKEAHTAQFWANVAGHHWSRRHQWLSAGFHAYFEPSTASVRFVRIGGSKGANPPWTREQLILALDLYVRHGGNALGPKHLEVIELSEIINQLAVEKGNADFRNAKGVAMKLMNFRSLDPTFTQKGGVGLKKIGKLDPVIWKEFEGRPLELAVAAEIIRANANFEPTDDDANSYSAKEGKVSYRYHRVLERNQKVVALRKRSALKSRGKLDCEVCGFDFVATYGPRGYGFIEAHHTNPVHAMQEGDETKPDDLALLCSNCHRMVHKTKPWLSLVQLRAILVGDENLANAVGASQRP